MKTRAQQHFYQQELDRLLALAEGLKAYIAENGVNEETLVRISDMLSIVVKLKHNNENDLYP